MNTGIAGAGIADGCCGFVPLGAGVGRCERLKGKPSPDQSPAPVKSVAPPSNVIARCSRTPSEPSFVNPMNMGEARRPESLAACGIFA